MYLKDKTAEYDDDVEKMIKKNAADICAHHFFLCEFFPIEQKVYERITEIFD